MWCMSLRRFLLLSFVFGPAITAVSAARVRDPKLDADLMPGWMGSDYESPDFLSLHEPRMEVLHEEARIFRFSSFLQPGEAEAVIAQATPSLHQSRVVNPNVTVKINPTVDTRWRTSSNTFINRGSNDVIKAIEARIAAWTLLPVNNGEDMQVLRYELNEYYKEHMDFLYQKEASANGGGRTATVLIYLSDVEEGGETIFPSIPAPPGDRSAYSECAKNFLAVKPRKGDAILFHSLKPSGALEPRAMHASCPVIKGTKWAASKWIHVAHFSCSWCPAGYQ